MEVCWNQGPVAVYENSQGNFIITILTTYGALGSRMRSMRASDFKLAFKPMA
jgi:hypothetical protein